MTLDTFVKKFDQFAAAPNAVAKMRELVLELAVQGKLVSQDPNDKPASAILKKIDESRRQLPRGAIRKKLEQIPAIDSEELPFMLPKGWEWCRLGSLGSIGSSCRVHQKDWTSSGVPFLRAREIVKLAKFGQVDNELFISEELFQELSKDGLTPEKDDLMITGVGTIGIPYIVKNTDRFYFKDASVLIFKNLFRQYPLYLHAVLQSPYGIKEIHRDSMGTTVHTLTIIRANLIPIPLPPLAEQKRIVAKVDELMALCDRLEAQQRERDAQASALARASLARFAVAPTPANLNLLFHKSYNISPTELRKAILAMAVKGKLVPQDPKEESAEKLIARLEEGRTVLAKKQGVRLPKDVPVLTAEDHPHDIPKTWKWSRIGHLALVIDYGTSQKSHGDSSKVPVYRMGNIVGGRLIDESLKYVDPTIDDLPKLYLKTDDILFNRTNSYELVGKSGIFTGQDDTTTFASYLIRIRLPSTLLFPTYFSVAMNAPYFRQTQIEPEVVQQCGQANFNGTKLSSTVVPVPPLAEQRRIVAKVDQLMVMVDQLETQLADSRATAKNLLDAFVAELTIR